MTDVHTARLRVQEIRARILDKHPQARKDKRLCELFGSLEAALLGMMGTIEEEST